MIKMIILAAMINTGDAITLPPDTIKIEARRRGKQHRGKRRPGGGLR